MTESGPRIADDEEAAALACALRIAEEGDGTLTRADVRGDLPEAYWGELLADGVLVPAEGGFVFDDPTAVRTALEEREFEPPEPEGWSRGDLAAAGVGLALVAGYRVDAIRDVVAGALDLALGPLVATLPFPAAVLALALATAVPTTVLANRDSPASAALSLRVRELRERLRDARARRDRETLEALREERRTLAGTQALLLTDHLRVLAWTMLATVPVFLYLSWLVAAPNAAAIPLVSVWPVLGEVVWTARLVGPVQVWMAWYALCSLVSRLVFRKIIPDRFLESAGSAF